MNIHGNIGHPKKRDSARHDNQHNSNTEKHSGTNDADSGEVKVRPSRSDRAGRGGECSVGQSALLTAPGVAGSSPAGSATHTYLVDHHRSRQPAAWANRYISPIRCLGPSQYTSVRDRMRIPLAAIERASSGGNSGQLSYSAIGNRHEAVGTSICQMPRRVLSTAPGWRRSRPAPCGRAVRRLQSTHSGPRCRRSKRPPLRNVRVYLAPRHLSISYLKAILVECEDENHIHSRHSLRRTCIGLRHKIFQDLLPTCPASI